MSDTPTFSGRNIPIYKAAEIMGKRPMAVQRGLRKGLLPFGVAIPREDAPGEYDYYISPKLFYEYTGAVINDLAVGDTDTTQNMDEEEMAS